MPFGIAHADEPVADDHGDHRIAAAAAAIHGAQRGEDVGRRDPRRADSLQLRRQHVEQHLGVRGGVEMAPVLALQDFAQLAGIGEIAVVRQADAVGRVHVERLGFRGAVASGGRIANMAHAHVAPELLHVVLLEYIAHQPATLAHEQLAFGHGRDARRVLAAVLQHRQRVINALVDRAGSDDSGNAAHSFEPSGGDGRKCFLDDVPGSRRPCRAGRRQRQLRRA